MSAAIFSTSWELIAAAKSVMAFMHDANYEWHCGDKSIPTAAFSSRLADLDVFGCGSALPLRAFRAWDGFEANWDSPQNPSSRRRQDSIVAASEVRFSVQTAKLSPHEQCATAFGFVTLKPPFW